MARQIRTLTTADADLLLAYAEAHMPYLGFVAINIARYGLKDTGLPFQGLHLGAFGRSGELTGVIGCYNCGSYVPYADDLDTVRELTEAALAERDPPEYVLGEETCARAALDVLAQHGYKPADIDEYVSQEVTPATFRAAPCESVRPAEARDIPAVAALRAAFHYEHFGREPDLAAEIASLEPDVPYMLGYIAEVEGRAVGTCRAHGVTTHAAQIGGMYVAPPARREGLGAALASALCRDLLVGRGRIVLFVRRSNEAAVRCYHKVGFSDVGPYLIVRMEL